MHTCTQGGEPGSVGVVYVRRYTVCSAIWSQGRMVGIFLIFINYILLYIHILIIIFILYLNLCVSTMFHFQYLYDSTLVEYNVQLDNDFPIVNNFSLQWDTGLQLIQPVSTQSLE